MHLASPASLFPDLNTKRVRDHRKVAVTGQGSLSIFKVLAPIPPVSWQHPCPDGLPALLRLTLSISFSISISIISGHCYRHLCSSHWPPAGDAGLFCCSTCGHPANRARGSKGTLRSLPAPKPTPAGRGGRTSPGTATTSLLSDGGEGWEGWRREGERQWRKGRKDSRVFQFFFKKVILQGEMPRMTNCTISLISVIS